MDNCFTGRHDRSRQTPEKDALYILPAGPVTECAFARWHRTSFLSRQRDVIASFSFGAWSVWTCFLQRDVLKFICEFIHFILLPSYSTEVSTFMSSPGQKRGTCCHIMAIFDGHLKCAQCRDKRVGEDNCILKKDCPICKAFTPEQIHQLSTPTYRERKNKDKKLVSFSPTPTPSHISIVGKVEGEKANVKPETTPAGKEKKRSDSPKPSHKSSKKKLSTSTIPSSEDLKHLDY